MTRKQKKIIKGYCWSTTTLGLVLGPGIDAAPLAAAWVAGCIHLFKDSGRSFDAAEVKSAIATIMAGFGAWFVSGKVAQYIAGLLVAGGLAGAGVSGGLTIIVGALATLSLNATVNALFTYRFLEACVAVIEGTDGAETIIFASFSNLVTNQLISLAQISQDLVKTAKLMFNPIL